MTGYGKAVAELPGKKITVEIKSLNSKQLDINTKLPWLYKEKESEIRNILNQKLIRGKIDISIYFDSLEDDVIPLINKTVVKNYYQQVKEIEKELGIGEGEHLLAAILRLPDSLKTEKADLEETEWSQVKKSIEDAANDLDKYRADEGSSINKDLRKCIGSILSLLAEIGPYEEARKDKIREKLANLLSENVGSENVDMNRFEQELIFYLERIDINEEKVRLAKHCEYFNEKADSESPNGKILNFISQEIGREINTIGSKANDASIQKIVVMMKDELEKIKEQTLNVL